MENTALENSIREEARLAIEAVKKREAEEIRQLDERFTADLEQRKREIDSESEERIAWERSRIANRGILEQRKLRLRTMEELAENSVDRAFKAVGTDPRYRDFLLRNITAALEQVPGEARIGLRKEDLSLEKDIREAIEAVGKRPPWAIEEDGSLARGGAVVEDREGGRVLNGAVDRIYFRKSARIRREVLDILKNHGFSE